MRGLEKTQSRLVSSHEHYLNWNFISEPELNCMLTLFGRGFLCYVKGAKHATITYHTLSLVSVTTEMGWVWLNIFTRKLAGMEQLFGIVRHTIICLSTRNDYCVYRNIDQFIFSIWVLELPTKIGNMKMLITSVITEFGKIAIDRQVGYPHQ